MTLDELAHRWGIELSLAGPNSVRIVAAAKPPSDEQRAAIVSYLPGLLVELRQRERATRTLRDVRAR